MPMGLFPLCAMLIKVRQSVWEILWEFPHKLSVTKQLSIQIN